MAVAVAFELRRVVPTVIVVAPAGTHATWRTELNNGGVRDCGIFTLQGLSSSKDGPTKRAVGEFSSEHDNPEVAHQHYGVTSCSDQLPLCFKSSPLIAPEKTLHVKSH